MADSQPGLEVVVSPADPEVASQSRSTLQNSHNQLDTPVEVDPIEYYNPQPHRPEAIYPFGKGGKGLISISSEEKNHGSASLAAKFLKGRRGRLILIGIGAFILIVVSGVVGGAVGSRRSSDSASSTTATATATATTTITIPTPTPQGTPISSSLSPGFTAEPSWPLQSNLGLSVAGWRTQNEFFSLRVFYQDQDDGLRFSEYKSDATGWGNSTKVDREDVLSNTSIGATVILEINPVSPWRGL